VSVGEPVEELAAAVGDRGSKIGAVRQLEGQNRRSMASMQPRPRFIAEHQGRAEDVAV